MTVSRLIGLTLVLMTGFLAGCATDAMKDTPTPTRDRSAAGPTLYQRLGEKPAITAVVDDFVARVAADSRINARFANTNIPRFKQNLVDQICAASGGPCTYTGRDMKTAHAGMGINNAEFDALVEDLIAALNKFKVGEREKNELLSVLGPMRKDIVERP
jgi:hemoglobin